MKIFTPSAKSFQNRRKKGANNDDDDSEEEICVTKRIMIIFSKVYVASIVSTCKGMILVRSNGILHYMLQTFKIHLYNYFILSYGGMKGRQNNITSNFTENLVRIFIVWHPKTNKLSKRTFRLPRHRGMQIMMWSASMQR